MVWFQCEACGEELKKPKLSNHFQRCSAYKLSCIDCGQMFDRQSAQGHTQCITEAEKYGPKGQAANGTPAKPNKEKSKPDVDINVGLSTRPPWFCSLCNTRATSQQALLLHADGKKHRGKARAFAANQQPNPPQEGAVTNKDSTENTPKNEVPNDKSTEDNKESPMNGNVTVKKRKNDASNNTEKCANGVSNGTVTQTEAEETPKKSKKARKELEVKGTEKKKAKNEAEKGGKTGTEKEGSEQKIKWKKLISSVLKSAPDGALKMKKLPKLVLKSLHESGIAVDDSEFRATLEDKVNSSSKFIVDGKYVRLVV
ncbi:hypothetical protein SOVF_149990 [Spinacia oleracea]|uniref:UBP1-associated proteins 1C isoform X1 n=1 Tax=Spinacia oleracea TaxID=3562 RepID=A0A9R0HQV2_SPIOL|nr:UBP1-associated proteins 1C isoform X1 [Spinacia oleracea]KNA09822.1 hypothetical protein SOVF_149990 [Spinacia oleracea]